LIVESTIKFSKQTGQEQKEALNNQEFDERFGSVFDNDGKISKVELTDFLKNYLVEGGNNLDDLI